MCERWTGGGPSVLAQWTTTVIYHYHRSAMMNNDLRYVCVYLYVHIRNIVRDLRFAAANLHTCDGGCNVTGARAPVPRLDSSVRRRAYDLFFPVKTTGRPSSPRRLDLVVLDVSQQSCRRTDRVSETPAGSVHHTYWSAGKFAGVYGQRNSLVYLTFCAICVKRQL